MKKSLCRRNCLKRSDREPPLPAGAFMLLCVLMSWAEITAPTPEKSEENPGLWDSEPHQTRATCSSSRSVLISRARLSSLKNPSKATLWFHTCRDGVSAGQVLPMPRCWAMGLTAPTDYLMSLWEDAHSHLIAKTHLPLCTSVCCLQDSLLLLWPHPVHPTAAAALRELFFLLPIMSHWPWWGPLFALFENSLLWAESRSHPPPLNLSWVFQWRSIIPGRQVSLTLLNNITSRNSLLSSSRVSSC